nr:hypothetical protein [Corynebacterium variabile]
MGVGIEELLRGGVPVAVREHLIATVHRAGDETADLVVRQCRIAALAPSRFLVLVVRSSLTFSTTTRSNLFLRLIGFRQPCRASLRRAVEDQFAAAQPDPPLIGTDALGMSIEDVQPTGGDDRVGHHIQREITVLTGGDQGVHLLGRGRALLHRGDASGKVLTLGGENRLPLVPRTPGAQQRRSRLPVSTGGGESLGQHQHRGDLLYVPVRGHAIVLSTEPAAVGIRRSGLDPHQCQHHRVHHQHVRGAVHGDDRHRGAHPVEVVPGGMP